MNGNASAQLGSDQRGNRPAESRPEVGDFVDEDVEPRLVLPPVLAPQTPRTGSGVKLVASGFRFAGNTVFGAETLSRVAEPWLDRVIGSEDLDDLANAVTRFYVEAGYVSSGAFVPDQDSQDGTILLQIVEGTFGSISVSGTRWFRDDYIRDRLGVTHTTPINIYALENKLQLLQLDPQIGRIDAKLTPGAGLGESLLSIDVEEESPVNLEFRYSNHQSPSVGDDGGELLLSFRNILGVGDRLAATSWFTSGFNSVEVGYTLPLNPVDTELFVGFRSSRSNVIEAPFEILDLENKLTTYRLGLTHPFFVTTRSRLSLGAAFEYRRSKTTFLGGTPFFGVPGSDDNGNVKILVFRFPLDWVWRATNQVVAFRSVVSVGIDDLEPDVSLEVGAPDGKFVSFLGQVQWVYQLSERFFGTQVAMRSDIQLASTSLVSMERFVVGGSSSVRGYRENTLVRDNGFASSIEFRVPLDLGLRNVGDFVLAPFFDVGRAWNDSNDLPTKTLTSAGVGLRYSWSQHFSAELYWAQDLNDVGESASGLQGDGVHFQITASMP